MSQANKLAPQVRPDESSPRPAIGHSEPPQHQACGPLPGGHMKARVERCDWDAVHVVLAWTRGPGPLGDVEGPLQATWRTRQSDDLMVTPRRYLLVGVPRVVSLLTGKRLPATRLTKAELAAAREAADKILLEFAWEGWWWGKVAYEAVWSYP